MINFVTSYEKKDCFNRIANHLTNKFVSSLITKDTNISSERPHAFYNDLIDRSNLWEEKIEKILAVNNLL